MRDFIYTVGVLVALVGFFLAGFSMAIGAYAFAIILFVSSGVLAFACEWSKYDK